MANGEPPSFSFKHSISLKSPIMLEIKEYICAHQLLPKGIFINFLYQSINTRHYSFFLQNFVMDQEMYSPWFLEKNLGGNRVIIP